MVELSESLQKVSIDGSEEEGGDSAGVEEIQELQAEINRLSDSIYEIEELRHASTSSTSSILRDRLNDLDTAMTALESRMTPSHTKDKEEFEFEALRDDWAALQKEYETLQGDMRDDGWLTRFRSTADQAEAMMAPIQSSLTSCLRYVESITSSPVPVPFESELEELPSIRKLQDLARSHEAMKSTYVPSVSKILKMMDRSIAERSLKNGEALRRYSDMSRQWSELQRQLQQLDARIRIVLSQHTTQSPGDNVEVLTDTASPTASSTLEYFARGNGQKLSAVDMRKTLQHRTSISSVVSGVSGTSAASMQRRAIGAQAQATMPTPEADRNHPALRKRTSMMSGISSSTVRTSDRGTPPVSTRPLPDQTMKTPNVRRFAGAGPRSGALSPSPVPSSASRLPVLSPTGPSPKHLEVPGSAPRGIGLPDPNWPKPVYGIGYGRRGGPPSLGGRSISSSAPRVAPPSSFRSMTPTPAGRSSSRMSMGSQAASMYAPPSLSPFQPSKYDLLDQHVQAVIEETHFQLFVARVDPSMKRGQRRAENEEWKGDFVFGAGQKISPVKLLKIAGRPGRLGFTQGAPRMKCLVRVRGAWQDLAELLKSRQGEEPAFGAESP